MKKHSLLKCISTKGLLTTFFAIFIFTLSQSQDTDEINVVFPSSSMVCYGESHSFSITVKETSGNKRTSAPSQNRLPSM